MSPAEENKFKARLVRTSSKDSMDGADRGKSFYPTNYFPVIISMKCRFGQII